MYATQQDLTDRFGIEELERYAWDPDADSGNGAPNTDRIQQALQDASETVDLYIGSITRLPLATTPPILVRLAADIARYRLQDDAPLEEARTRYEDAIGTLKDLAAGRATLGLPEAPPTGATVDALRGDGDRLFTRESLEYF